MTSHVAGLAVATFFIAIGAVQLLLALRLPGGSLAEPGPNLFPLLVAVLMVIAATSCLVQELAWRSSGRLNLKQRVPQIGAIVLAIALFIVLLPRTGFVPAAFLLQVGLLRLFGLKRVIVGIAAAAATTAAAVFVFQSLLGVQFPRAQWLG